MTRTIAVFLGLFSILLCGCDIKWQVVQDPYPNFHLIERRARSQALEIDGALQNGQLAPPMAQALADNVAIVRQLAWEYQNGPNDPITDLTPAQTRFLGVLLNDNALALNDAVQRHQQWEYAFQGGWDFDFDYRPDRILYVACVHYQLERQTAMVEDALGQGSLSQAQADDLRQRIVVIRSLATDYFVRNSAFDLTRDQMERLSQMLDDNSRYLRFRSGPRHRERWSGDRFRSWGKYKDQYHPNPSSGTLNAPTQSKRYWDGRPVQAAPAPAVPSPATPTRVPSAPPPPPTATAVPAAPVLPTATPTAIPRVLTPTPQPSPIRKHPDHEGHGGGKGDGWKKNKSTGDQGEQDEDQHGSPGSKDDGKRTETAPPPGDPGQKTSPTGEGPSPPAGPALVPPDALNTRFQAITKRMQFGHNAWKGSDWSDLVQKRNDFRRSLNDSLAKNGRKGITQEQADQLSKMLDDMEKILPPEDP